MIDAAGLRQFRDEGYAVVAGAVPAPVVHAAAAAAWELAGEPAPGPRFVFPSFADVPAVAALWDAVAPTVSVLGEFGAPAGAQLAVTYPPFPRGAGRPHVDGAVPGSTQTSGRPGTFSLLAGFPLTDQSREGGLWVWPGSHREHAALFASRGENAFWQGDPGFPDVATAAPVQVRAVPGDLVLCHYLLGHCPAGVVDAPRITAYLRLEAVGHADRWKLALTDPDADFS